MFWRRNRSDTTRIMTDENEAKGNKNDSAGSDRKCGIDCCNNAKGALAFLGFAAFLQGTVVNGLFNISVSTLEKRFLLKSSETGMIASTYDIAGCLSIPLVTYVGGRGRKPLWVGTGVLLMGLGSLLFSLPHFLAPRYSLSENATYVCGTTTDCDETSVRAFRGFFIVSQLLQGIGATPLYTLGITYLDENVAQVYTSIFHGIFLACSILGPGVGYLLGGFLLTRFTNLHDEVSISQDSPMWIGNWWLGFLTVGVIQILLSFPILMYPKYLPGTENVRLNRDTEIHVSRDAVKAAEDQSFGTRLRDAPRTFLMLLKNPTLIFLSLAASLESGLAVGMATFGPKYIESMYSLSASTSAFYFGILAIACASSAQILSGLVVSKLNLTMMKMVRMSMACSVTAFLFFFVFLDNCQNSDIAGVVVPYTGETEISCVQSLCGCTVNLYDPVCGADGLTYTSFCDAGCTDYGDSFVNCTRIASESRSLANATAASGICSNASLCPRFTLFFVCLCAAVFFTFFKGQSSFQTLLRCVPFNQRSIALGLQWIIVRTVGSIPMPILYGKALDVSCLLWKENCQECGSCLIYENRTMAVSIFTVTLVLKVLNISLLAVVMWTVHRNPANFAHTELKEDTDTETKRTSATHEPIRND